MCRTATTIRVIRGLTAILLVALFYQITRATLPYHYSTVLGRVSIHLAMHLGGPNRIVKIKRSRVCNTKNLLRFSGLALVFG